MKADTSPFFLLKLSAFFSPPLNKPSKQEEKWGDECFSEKGQVLHRVWAIKLQPREKTWELLYYSLENLAQ